MKITPQPLTTEEMYKLWSAFQTTYRVSAAYEVSVVLIDSARPVNAALPVLAIESGNGAQPNLESPYPTLTAVTPPGSRDYALMGDTLTLTGLHLNTGSSVTVRFKHRLLTAPIDLIAANVTETSATVQLPALQPPAPAPVPSAWPVGIYTVTAIISNANPALIRTTNELPLVLAPKIIAIPTATRTAQGNTTIVVRMSPQVWSGQSVMLLVGSIALTAPSPTTTVNSLSFSGATPAGQFYLRLRVDGIDSPVIVNNPTPSFDPTVRVTL